MGLINRNKDSSAADRSLPPTRRRSNTHKLEDSGPSFADDPLDPLLDVKKRARRRLIGAFALAVGAVVFVPMIFDAPPKPALDDIAIEIPDKNVSLQVTPAAPVAKTAAPVNLAPAEPVPSAPVDPIPANLSNGTVNLAVSPAAPSVKTPEAAAEKIDKSALKTEIKSETKSKDDARALALLEGSNGIVAQKTSEPISSELKTEAKPADTGASASFAVQIGAFSDPAKVKSLHEKLSAAGLKTYTEVVKTTQGERTRLRLGPYATREAADKTQERVKKLFALDATIVPLQ